MKEKLKDLQIEIWDNTTHVLDDKTIETIISLFKEKAMQIKYAKHNPPVDCECEDCRVANAILEVIK